jgi:hypothetical protein
VINTVGKQTGNISQLEMIDSAVIAVEAIKIKSLALVATAIWAAEMSDKTGGILLVIIH